MAAESPKNYDVFLSYSSQDKTWAEAACAVLERNQIRCWITPRDIMPGDEWGAAIIKGIHASRIMVLIFSGHANASPQVRREVERAISRSQVVLPIRIENINPEGAMEYALGNTHWLDAFTPPIENQLHILAKAVKTLLEAEPQTAKTSGQIEPGKTEHVEASKATGEIGSIRPTATTWARPWRLAGAAILFATFALILGLFLSRGWQGPEEPQERPPDTSQATIDLLTRVANNAKREQSHWEFRGSSLYSTGSEADYLRLPVRAPSEYRLELTVARIRRGGMSDFTIGMVCGENRCAVLLDGWGGTVSGISYLDGKVAIDNETKYAGGIFSPGKPAAIVVTVRRRSIHVTVDGKTIVNWRGDPARLSVVPPSPPGSRMLTIGAFGGYFRVDKLTLTPLPDSPMRKAK